jgi:hypothetical protein
MIQNSPTAVKINKQKTFIIYYKKYTLNLFGKSEGSRPPGRPSRARDAFRSIEQRVRPRRWMSSTRSGSSERVIVNTVMNLHKSRVNFPGDERTSALQE